MAKKKKSLSERQIEEFYDSAEYRITQERNDFLLPQIVDFVRARKWVNIRPEYQRRLVWSDKEKSLLIESLLMNVPVPPIFLYEHDLNRYEVMDGQQRINSVIEFYENRLTLRGLEKWNILNGRTYSECPPRIQRGFDRRRISATVLLAESTMAKSGSDDLRILVFERLNTGGLKLTAQEMRNCLYSGPFNDLIVELAGFRPFNEIWDIPPYDDNISGDHITKQLMTNSYYKRMKDCELVLRFFAFRQKSKVRGAVKRILDSFMNQNRNASARDLDRFRQEFTSRIQLAYEIFGKSTFRLPGKGGRDLSIPLYDAVMVALDRLYASRKALISNRAAIRKALAKALANGDTYELIVARANTAPSILQRQDFVEGLFRDAIK